jgi:hypothetical protein
MRRDATYGPVEDRPPPTPRTHEGIVRDGLANDEHKGYKKDTPYKNTGVKELSPLGALPLFDLAWDVLGDMMHILTGIWKRHIFEMLHGNRHPAKPKNRTSWTFAANRALQRDHLTVIEKLREWTLSDATHKVTTYFVFTNLTFSDNQIVDGRSISLGGSSGWIRNNLEVFKHKSVLTSHDWILLCQSAGDYLLHDVFPDDTTKEECLLAIKEACSLCISSTSAFDSENRTVIDQVKQAVVEAMCVAEAKFPKTELAVMFHVLIHIPDAIHRWNNRNYWSFFGERYTHDHVRGCDQNLLCCT